MFDIPKEYENLVNIIFLIVTAAIAYHGLTFRRPDGESDWKLYLFKVYQAYALFVPYHDPERLILSLLLVTLIVHKCIELFF